MIYHGDCLDIMPTLADKSIDLTVTSPPYDNLRAYNNSLVWNFDIFQKVAKELFRVTKNGGVVVWVVCDATIKGSETGTSFKQALYFREIGFNLHDTMIWDKPFIVPRPSNRYESSSEYMFVLSKGTPKTVNLIKDKQNIGAGRKITGHKRGVDGKPEYLHGATAGKIVSAFGTRHNVWVIDANRGSHGHNHPASFPLKLATDHILSWSNEGDTVLDPFAGSGTTGIACLNTGRKFILIEKDAGYCEIIKNRIANHQPLLQAVNA